MPSAQNGDIGRLAFHSYAIYEPVRRRHMSVLESADNLLRNVDPCHPWRQHPMDREIIEGNGELERRFGGLAVFGRGLLSDKNRCEYKEHQTYSFHREAIINHDRY